MGTISRFKESTMQQVFAILIVLAIAVVVAFIKIPQLQVYTYSWKLNWSTSYEPVDVLDEMMTLKVPQVLKVLAQHMNDEVRIQQPHIDKREEFYEEDRVYLRDYCVFLTLKYTEYEELNYKNDQYTWAEEFRYFNSWLESHMDVLVWDEEEQKFIDPGNQEE